ncbi:Short-chain dehydrogenase/reductase family protein [Mycena sanguinolenta]|uniref:Short-chain dehydrogenase/reductase family protein n=1 Tax=Mycena sanguinolenta TaxID=230812 RepID=A0A8H6XYV2_9AGAR|nr:Short-chain dehydrogenase/reductase family protein [Mycena sanguinolenta]
MRVNIPGGASALEKRRQHVNGCELADSLWLDPAQCERGTFWVRPITVDDSDLLKIFITCSSSVSLLFHQSWPELDRSSVPYEGYPVGGHSTFASSQIGIHDAATHRVGHGSTRGYPKVNPYPYPYPLIPYPTDPRVADPYGSPAGVAVPALPLQSPWSLLIGFPFDATPNYPPGFDYTVPREILHPTIGFILLHHVAFVNDWPTPGLAIVDLILILLEGCAEDSFVNGLHSWEHAHKRALPTPPTTILLNRSVARPLVRGESMVIIVARALTLTCIALGVPVFGIYAMVISPIQASVYTRSVATFATGGLGLPNGNVTFLLGLFGINSSISTSSDFAVNQVTVLTQSLPDPLPCSVASETPQVERLVECPLAWASLQEWSTISINLTIPSGYAVNIMPLQDAPEPSVAPLGALSSLNTKSQSDFGSVHLQIPSDSVPVVPGSHLFGRLTWTQRETLSRSVLGVPTSSKPVFAAEITGLQPYPSDSSAATNEATLVLFHPYPYAIKLQQDSSDITPLSGLSTFGGFWTFVEGAFVLLFGANVMYFALGRRPLSALGLIHIFQRRTLVRQWHTDFPSLRTEGGQPGSESAGIVAFIRERLIDIDQGPEMDAANDIEAQHSRSSSDSQEDLIRASTKERDYEHGPGELEQIDSNPS